MRHDDSIQGGYQDALRVIGAWLDIRGMHTVRIVENNGELLIEASNSTASEPSAAERFRLDRESIDRLCRAARHDRGMALSRSLFSRNGDLSTA